jgi:excisionase family DNA binding protein
MAFLCIMQQEPILFSQISQSDLLAAIRAVVKDELKSAKALDEQNRLLTVREVGTMFGITKMTVYNWISKGELTPVKKGKRTFFRKDEIDRSMIQLKKYKHY